MDISYTITAIDGVFILALSLLLGFEVIKNIPAVLHTPLMSGSNAISGIILFGGIVQLLNTPLDHVWTLAAASLAVLLGSINLAGGFFVTHRMLSMFSVKRKPANGRKA
ncbi:MAG: NAD(P) transhydrogenase subunit alpha [Flavobacteriales bacterium]